MVRVVDWNINGGHLIKGNSVKKDFDFFLKKIKNLNPDILLIQEGHISENFNQMIELSKEIGLKYYKCQELGESHIEKGNQLCLFVLSKYEIIGSNFFEFTNPNLVSFNENYGGEIRSDIFKKGFLKAEIEINNEKVNVISGHAHALHIFGKSFDDFPHLIDEIKEYILVQGEKNKMILGSDLNYENLTKTFTSIFTRGIKLAFSNVKTYGDVQFDYIMLSKNFNVINKNIDFCTDDHALICVDIKDN